jgi:hypothetical protein
VWYSEPTGAHSGTKLLPVWVPELGLAHIDETNDHDYANTDSHAATDDATTDKDDPETRNPLVSGTHFVKPPTWFARRQSVTAAASCRPAPPRGSTRLPGLIQLLVGRGRSMRQ